MMKVNFLKRLESSVRVFRITMERTVSKIEDLENGCGSFRQHQASRGGRCAADFFDRPRKKTKNCRGIPGRGKLVYRMEHLDVAAWLKALPPTSSSYH
jgi:hypothetical protein